MSFPLYAAGAGGKEILELKRRIGYDQLLSQYTERKACIEWAEYKRAHPECQSKLFIDSGAFTAFTKKKVVDVDDYIEFINSIDDAVTIFAQVDKIPGEWGKERTPEELAEAPRLSWENYLYMVNKVKSPEKLLPIFHQGEDFSWLENMLNYKYTEGPLKGQYIKYIGISCSKDIPSSAWAPWFNLCFKMIKESPNPNVQTHAFGMTSLKTLEQYPFTSADSTSWIKFASFGSVLVDGKPIYVSSRNFNNPDHILVRSPAIQERVEEVARKHGFSLFELVDDATTAERKVALENLSQIFNDYNEKFGSKGIHFDLPDMSDNQYLVHIRDKMENTFNMVMNRYEGEPLTVVDETKGARTIEEDFEDRFNRPKSKGSGSIRFLMNLCTLKDWANEYEYIGTEDFKEDLW